MNTSPKMRTAVLISGRGSNSQALINATRTKDFPAEIALVVSNKRSAYGIERAKKANVPGVILDDQEYKDTKAYEKALDKLLHDHNIEFICLAGYMKILSPWFVKKWHNKLINIHPSLLPAFKGLDTHTRALEAGVKFAGCTVHYVRDTMDVGPIIIQATVPVKTDDTPALLADRVLDAEHLIYPQALKWAALNRLALEGEKVTLQNAPRHSFNVREDMVFSPPLDG